MEYVSYGPAPATIGVGGLNSSSSFPSTGPAAQPHDDEITLLSDGHPLHKISTLPTVNGAHAELFSLHGRSSLVGKKTIGGGGEAGVVLPKRRSFPPDCFQILRLMEGNERCVDCGVEEENDDGEVARKNCRVTYASVSYGTLLCGTCAFRHIDRDSDADPLIKSLTEDEWSLPEVLRMLEGGNAAMLKFFRTFASRPARRFSMERRSSFGAGRGGGTGGSPVSGETIEKRYKSKAATAYRKKLGESVDVVREAHGAGSGTATKQNAPPFPRTLATFEHDDPVVPVPEYPTDPAIGLPPTSRRRSNESNNGSNGSAVASRRRSNESNIGSNGSPMVDFPPERRLSSSDAAPVRVQQANPMEWHAKAGAMPAPVDERNPNLVFRATPVNVPPQNIDTVQHKIHQRRSSMGSASESRQHRHRRWSEDSIDRDSDQGHSAVRRMSGDSGRTRDSRRSEESVRTHRTRRSSEGSAWSHGMSRRSSRERQGHPPLHGHESDQYFQQLRKNSGGDPSRGRSSSYEQHEQQQYPIPFVTRESEAGVQTRRNSQGSSAEYSIRSGASSRGAPRQSLR